MVNIQAKYLSIRNVEGDYLSIILQDRWLYISPKGQVLNEEKGHWTEDGLFFLLNDGSCLVRSHVFVER